jgi:hypothetical protein
VARPAETDAWHGDGIFLACGVIAVLRFIGILNAAVWFGAALFFTFGIAPAFFTTEMKKLLGEIYAGLVAQMVLERYFVLHYCCGAIALVHQLAEWVYLGKPLQRITFGLLLAILTLNLAGGLWLKPKLAELNRIRFAQQYSAVQRDQATQAFRSWHGVSMVMNLAVLAGLGFFAWRLATPPNGTRFVTGKFRS